MVPNNQIFKGYFLEPDKTKEVIDEDGWFHTGDIVSLLPNYAVKIIDRKKSIFKLAQGEYICPDHLELEYSKISIIKQIFVYGDPTKDHIVAIIVPEQVEVQRWTSSSGVDESSALESEEFIQYLNQQFQEKKLENGFNSLEVPKRFCFTYDEMTIDNNVLTPTMKVNRHNAKFKYIDLIRELYNGAALQGD